MFTKYHFTEEDIVKIVMAYHAAAESTQIDYPDQATNAYEADQAFEVREKVIQDFAKQFNCSPASIRGKLVVEKRYIARSYIPKRLYRANKERVVERLETALGLEQGSLDSLEKVNRSCMENLVQGLKLSQNGIVNFDFGMFFEYVDCPASYTTIPPEFKIY